MHKLVEPLLSVIGAWPTVGTPAWCALDNDDRKLCAIYDAAQHWALRVETAQTAQCDASREVCAAADWSAIAWEKFWLDRAIIVGTYIARVTS